MRIQINNRKITIYGEGINMSSQIPSTPEIESLISDLEDYIQTQKSPEFIALEEAHNQKELAEQAKDAIEIMWNEIRETLENILNNIDSWEVAKSYEVGKLLAYDGKLYEVRQEHTSQEDWLPNELPALYRDITKSADEPQDFVQPTGEHDSYQIDDLVIWQGKVYKSLINSNVWSPTDHPQGWEEVDE